MKIEIKNRFTGEVIYTGEHETLRDAVVTAVANRADLSGAYLSGAYLSGANLSGANLRRANLSGANLSDAGLSNTIMPGFADELPTSLKEAAIKTKEWLLDGHWTRGKWIETPTGAYAGDCKACLHGAAVYIGGPFGPALSQALDNAGYGTSWNDDSVREVAEVAAALDQIAQAA